MASSRRSSPPAYVHVRPWHRARAPLDHDFGLEDLFREHLVSSEPEEEFEEDDEVCFETLFFGEKFVADWAVRNAERLKREAEERKREEEAKKKREEQEAKRKAEEWKWRQEELVRCAKEHRAVIRSIRRYNPKAKTVVWTRFPFANFFNDLNQESPYPPMRNTNKKYHCLPMFDAANILTIKIVSSDVGFPIDVYGTAIARDSLDYYKCECVYLFRCNRRDSQLIKTDDESLILTGPARGLILSDFIYLEVDLKIKGARGQDKQLSKGLLEIDGRILTRLETNEVMLVTCASQLSTVQAKFTVVKDAVEATVEIHVLWGYFHGQISVHTSSILDEFVLFKGETGGVLTNDGSRIIPHSHCGVAS